MQQNSNTPKLYTVYEAAKCLRCCDKTITNRIKQGVLRAVKNGRKWLVPADAIDDFIRGGGTVGG